MPDLEMEAMSMVTTRTTRLAGYIFLAGFFFGAISLFVTMVVIALAEGYL